MKTGIIGIGAMGMAMAKNLHRNGVDIVVRDIRAEAEREAQVLGMTIAVSPAALAAQVDLIIVAVVDAQQIEAVLFGPDGVMSNTPRATTIMLCSTIAPEQTARFSMLLARDRIDTIDAPISGGPARAEAGTISMMLAAPRATLDRHARILAALSDKHFYIGEQAGDGAKAKLVNNLLAGINLVAGAEALALGMRVGLDRQRLFELICASSGASWIFQDRMSRALQEDFEPRAAAHILTKDLSLATAMADAADYATPLGDAALAVFRETVERGWAELDDAVVLRTYVKGQS